MSSKEYLQQAQKSDDALRIVLKSRQYHPISYAIRFDKIGRAKHTAVLHSVKADSILNVKLEDVDP